MKAFAHRTPRELRTFALQAISLPGAGFLAALAAVTDFDPGWAKALVLAGVVAGVVVGIVARFTRFATARFTTAVTLGTMVLTVVIGLTIQPQAIGALSAFVFLGIGVGAAAFLRIRVAFMVSAACTLLGLVVIVLRSSVPVVGAIVFVALMTITILVVIVLRQSLQATRDDAVAQSVTDSLTGLTNRRGMEVNLPLMSALAARSGQQLGCLVIDIDHFKTVNDTLGHLAGDTVLRQTADALVGATRASDLCVRIGGDEFAVFTVVPTLRELEIVADRLREAVERSTGVSPRTVSIGGTLEHDEAVIGDGKRADALLSRADQALYAAKSAGRNAVRMA